MITKHQTTDQRQLHPRDYKAAFRIQNKQGKSTMTSRATDVSVKYSIDYVIGMLL